MFLQTKINLSSIRVYYILLLSGKNSVIFSNSFLRCAEQLGICLSSDIIDSVVIVSLYFTLHLYFRNTVNVPQCYKTKSSLSKQAIISQKANANFYQNISIRHKYQSLTKLHQKYINALKKFHHLSIQLEIHLTKSIRIC